LSGSAHHELTSSVYAQVPNAVFHRISLANDSLKLTAVNGATPPGKDLAAIVRHAYAGETVSQRELHAYCAAQQPTGCSAW
jgi:hypothetical protein